jgi:hypothetical protein
MTPEQEIARIKSDYKEHWTRLEQHPGIQKAIAEKNPIKLGEIAAMVVYGSYYDKGAAHQASHPVTAFINYEAVEFVSIESAKKYIEHQKSLNPSLNVGIIFKRTKDGGMEEVSI